MEKTAETTSSKGSSQGSPKSSRPEMTVVPRKPGKHFSRALRRERMIPAVVYGAATGGGKATDKVAGNPTVAIDERLVRKFNTRAFENSLFTLRSDDKKLNNIVALMKSVTVHPLTRQPEHVDLFALDLTKSVRVRVEINFEGKPIGLAEGGLLNIVNRQVEIECLPTAIPEALKIDISNLSVGDALHVSDLSLPSDVKLISHADLTLAVVNLYEEEVVAPVADATVAAAPAAGAAAPAAGAAPAKDAKATDAKAAPAKDAKAPAKDKK